MFIKVILFLILNFAALAIGGMLMGEGASSEWYKGLNIAPWTPPGWMFGVAWTIIMVCFSLYMAAIWKQLENRKTLLTEFIVQWILNVLWNPIFFYFHQATLGLITIVLLTLTIGYLFIKYKPKFQFESLLLMPYLIWLIIATSLNGYIVFFNP